MLPKEIDIIVKFNNNASRYIHNSRDKMAVILTQHQWGNFKSISKDVCNVCPTYQYCTSDMTVQIKNG